MGYNPSLPVSANNPTNTLIPTPNGMLPGFTLMPSINGGTLSPTFYTTGGGHYYYWNGVNWVNTGHTTGNTAAINIGGCGSALYNVDVAASNSIYVYNGSGNGTFLTAIPSGACADIVTDCSCNFYVLNPTNQTYVKYNPAGLAVTNYSILGLPTNLTSGAFAMLGNDIYCQNTLTGLWYKGTIGSGLSISFNTVSISLPNDSGSDYASCPVSVSVAVNGTLNTSGMLCPGQTNTISATTTVVPASFAWLGAGIVGPANGSVVTVSATGVYSCIIASTLCPSSQITLTTSLSNNGCISFVSNSITCASLGSATANVLGTGPFSYTWLPGGQNTSVVTGLNPGNYTVKVFDSVTSKTFSASTNFVSLVPLTGTLNVTPSITCYGASTGTANYTNLAGGSANQNYLWSNGSLNYTVANPNNLSAGNWSSTVTDALTGCIINNSFVITQPPALTLNVVASSATACAGNSIVLSGSNSGGSPIPTIGYNYNWVSGPASNTNMVSQSLGAAYIYTLNSSDVFGCSITKTISVSFVPNPSITVANVSICPLQTATLGANGASTYTWNGFFIGGSFVDNPLISTQYSVVGSALGCTAAATASIILKSLPFPTLITNAPRCNGDNLLLSGNGGVSYTWSGPLGYNSFSQNPILNTVGLTNAGVYNLTVTAANSCTASTNATVVVNPTPTLSAFGSTVCTIQTASLSANSVNGATYVWSGPLSFSSTQQSISIPSPSLSQSGVYNLTVTSVLGCNNTTSIDVLVVAPPNLSIALSSPSICAQALSGSPNTIVLDANGASTYTLITPNHIANSNPSGPSSSLSLLPPYMISGPATATLLGSNGICAVSKTATFNVIPNPTLSAISPTPVICAGQSFTYTSSGASSYTWSSPNPSNYFYTTGNIAVVNPSINSVFSVVGGSLGCLSAMQISNITVNPLPVVNIVGNALICPGTSATLSALGTGTSFSWSPNIYLNNSSGIMVLASPPSPQNYQIIASLNTCTTSAMVTVSVLPLPVAQITAPQSYICQNENIVLSGSGGPMQMVAYLWQTPIGYTLSSKNLQLKAINSDFGGNYVLTVTDQNNCKASGTQSITVYNLPQGYLTSPTMQGCAPLCSDFNFKTTNGTAAISEISWQVENDKFNTKSFQYCFPLPGDYIITGDFSDIHNCVNTVTALVNVYPKPKADFEFSPTQPVENLETVQFNNTSKGADQYSWYFAKDAYISNKKDPTFLFETTGSYPVVLVAQNQWNCKDSIIKVIHVDPDFAVYVPNAFTPNEDGLNDSFLPVLRGSKNFTFTVFDRWGKIVFESSDITKAWDGTFKGEVCPAGIYVWKLVVSSQSGLSFDAGIKAKSLSGEVMLYR